MRGWHAGADGQLDSTQSVKATHLAPWRRHHLGATAHGIVVAGPLQEAARAAPAPAPAAGVGVLRAVLVALGGLGVEG